MTGKTVLVLEADAKASVPIIESCVKMGLNVIVGSSKKYCCGFYTRGVSEKVIYPSDQKYPAECISFIVDFIRKEQVSVVFPVGDVMTDLVARHQDEFRKYANLLLPPYDVFKQGRDKILTLKAAAAAGCPIPPTWYPKERNIKEISQQMKYPVLIKPAISAGARGITFCYKPEDLIEKYLLIEKSFGDCFVQKFVSQTGTQYKVDIVLEDAGKIFAGVVYEKLRYYPATGGSSVLNKTVYRPDILESAVKVLSQIGWKGFCDFDFITDPDDGIVKLMEINPRFPESYLATVSAGVDMTKIIYQLAMGQKPQPQLDYAVDRYTRFLLGDIMWFLTTKKGRWNAKPNFFNFFRRDTKDQLLRVRDWGPIFGYILQNLSMIWDSEEREYRLRFGNIHK